MPPAHSALSRQQVREADRRAIEEWGIPGVVLMENAGRGATDAIEELLGGAAGRSIAVVAGRGNNGGDGFVIARHLTVRRARCEVFLVAEAESLSGDAAVNYAILPHVGVPVHPAADGKLPSLAGFDLIVDAVGGTGITGPLRGALAEAVERINAAGVPVAAVDIPTGLDCDTGAAPGPTVKAQLTVTFHARKTGFDAPGASQYTGKVVVADIGIPVDGRGRH